MPAKKKAPANFFPSKLHNLLENAARMGYSNVISWQEGGHSFKIHDPDTFVSRIMPRYFKQTKLKSFQRQLNIYGWKRVGTGKNRGGYHHPSFVQGIPELCLLLKRSSDGGRSDSVDSIHVSQNMDCNTAPLDIDAPEHAIQCNRLLMSGSTPLPLEPVQFFKGSVPMGSSSASSSSLLDSLNPLCGSETGAGGFFSGSNPLNACTPRIISSSGRMHMSDELKLFADLFTSRDFQMERRGLSTMGTSRGLPPKTPVTDEAACENVFPQKLHFLLNQAEKEGFSHIISWCNDGAAFKVHDSKQFLEKIMPSYFDQSKFESFRRQLNLYGFRRISRGANRGIYYHQFFLKSEPSLCASITRPSSTTTPTTAGGGVNED